MQTCIPSMSGVIETAACPPSPIADDPSALPSPSSSPSSSQSVTLLACSLGASPRMSAVVLDYLYFSRYYSIILTFLFFIFYVWFFFMDYLCEKYYKSIAVQYCIADCVRWVPRLNLLYLGTNWTWNGTHSYMGGLLYLT